MNLIIQKFGRTSLASPGLVRLAAERVASAVNNGRQVIVVASACGHDTDELLALAPAVLPPGGDRDLDLLVATGEQKAAALVCLALRTLGIDAVSLTGGQAGILTDARDRHASIVEVRTSRLRELMDCGVLPVVCGAQGATFSGDITFLGRGGSDTTAVALAVALAAEQCELYTNVAGIFTADPALVPAARLLASISYSEMLAMCQAGCPTPAASAVELARDHHVELHVRSAFAASPGTRIGRRTHLKDSARRAPLVLARTVPKSASTLTAATKLPGRRRCHGDQNEAGGSVKRLIPGTASRPSGHDWNAWSAHATTCC
jgi:aspartate kinase